MNKAETELLYQRIVGAEIDGFGIRLTLENGCVFNYEASDGGYSLWEIRKEDGGQDEI